jgi:hypothetical protein
MPSNHVAGCWGTVPSVVTSVQSVARTVQGMTSALCALDTSVSTGTPYPPWFKVLAHRVVQSNPLYLSPFSGLSTLHTCTVGAPTRTVVYICCVRRGGSGVPDLPRLSSGS